MYIKYHKNIVLFLLAISFLLLSLATFLGGGEAGMVKILQIVFTPTPLQIVLAQCASALLFMLLALLAMLGFMLAMRDQPKTIANYSLVSYVDHFLAYGMILLALFPLLSLLADVHWIASLGGFPAIGSGQGIIKYFSVVAIALYFLQPIKLTAFQLAVINYVPVALVLLWIGGMKFTAIEAAGIEGLVRSSPFMGWLYQLFDVQVTSDIIGVYDLLAMALLGVSLWKPRLFIPSALMCLAVFLTTQTFLLSFDGALSSETVLAGTGQFIIKDLWFVANLVIMAVMLNKSKTAKIPA